VSVDCTHLAGGMKQQQALEDTVMKIWVLLKAEIILINLTIITFLNSALCGQVQLLNIMKMTRQSIECPRNERRMSCQKGLQEALHEATLSEQLSFHCMSQFCPSKQH